MNRIRNQRLSADHQKLLALVESNGDRLAIQSIQGTPPYRYEVTIRCKSVVAFRGGRPVYGENHMVRISLPPGYPLQDRPRATLLTPIAHPHIFSNRDVCIGSQGSVTEFLDAFVRRLYDILRYDPRYLDPRSPANLPAMEWAQLNRHLFPLDPWELRAPGIGKPEPPPIVWINHQ